MTEPTIADTVHALYRALGDRPAFDAHLHPDLTMWETDAPDLLRGLADLDALRDRRAPAVDAVPPVSVAPEDLLIEEWDDTGLARYVLRAAYAGRPDTLFRVTDVFRRDGSGWRIVHHHAEESR
ncbi:nuclear transport factor 2 family protein [Longispora sp. NPDC051575]|uniref:nuclear transport factor 2 family protein n=1 Tax=Longispora sp. NPDC051575 TaxID=3154943 RepID=UPI003414D845